MNSSRLRRQKRELERLVAKKAERERAARPCPSCSQYPLAGGMNLVRISVDGTVCALCAKIAAEHGIELLPMIAPRGVEKANG